MDAQTEEMKPVNAEVLEASAQPKPKAETLPVRFDSGILVFENDKELDTATAYLEARAMSVLPENFTKIANDVSRRGAIRAAIITLAQFKLPLRALNRMYFVGGRLEIHGELYTALAERHPEYGEKVEFFLDSRGKRICTANENIFEEVEKEGGGKEWVPTLVRAAVCRVKKKNSTEWDEHFFTWDDAVDAGLVDKNANYRKYPKDMLMNRARPRALKANYASALMGAECYTGSADPQNAAPNPKTQIGVAGELNSL